MDPTRKIQKPTWGGLEAKVDPKNIWLLVVPYQWVIILDHGTPKKSGNKPFLTMVKEENRQWAILDPFLTMVTEEIRQVKNDNYRERFEPDDNNPCVLNESTNGLSKLRATPKK
jgi:hypothetical protein